MLYEQMQNGWFRPVTDMELIDRAANAATVLSPWWIALDGVCGQLKRPLTEHEEEFFYNRVKHHLEKKKKQKDPNK